MIFLAPLFAVRELPPLAYFLSGKQAIAELALEIFALLLIEAICAALLTIIFSAGSVLKLLDNGSEAVFAGVLTFATTILCVLVLLSPLNATIGPIASFISQAAMFLVAAALITIFGWRRMFIALNRINQSAQMALAICPLLLLPVLAGGFGWRSFDSIPPPRRVAPNSATRTNVVLISFDALSAQDMSLYGYNLPTTPEFKRLAQHSYNFINFFSTSDFTTPAAASLLTGKYPLTNRVFQLYGHIPHRMRGDNLAWVLRRHGYTTAAIVTNPAAHPLTLRIADSFSTLPWPPISSWLFPGTFLMQLRNSLLFNAANSIAVDALRNFGCLFNRFNTMSWVEPEKVFRSAEGFIRGARTPYFLWIHLYPPHAPYITSASFRGRYLPGPSFTTQAQFLWKMPEPTAYRPGMQPEIDRLRLRYDESIAECDSSLGRFADWMAKSGYGANTLLVVTSDHGENFSGGWWGHESPDLHYAETHIPLLISVPGQNRGYTEAREGDLTDIAPTILAEVGILKPSWMEGHPLIYPEGRTPSSEQAFSMYLARSSVFSRPEEGAIAADSWPYHLVLYFPSEHVELFDISHDAEGMYDVAAFYPGVARALAEDIKRRFGETLDSAPVSRSP